MYKTILLPAILMALTLALPSCAPRTPSQPLTLEGGILAVAGFSHPVNSWEYLSSYRSQHPPRLSGEQLEELDAMLNSLLLEEPGRMALGPDTTRQCQELTLSGFRDSAGTISGQRYWLKVGQCVPADYLLVPQILEWKEREGGEWGVSEPAMVVFELTLLDISNEQVLRRYHFEEFQRSLSEDLLQARKFFRRGGKWLTTKELVYDGLRDGLREMGL